MRKDRYKKLEVKPQHPKDVCSILAKLGISTGRYYSVCRGIAIKRDNWMLPIISKLSKIPIEKLNVVEDNFWIIAKKYNKEHPFDKDIIESFLYKFLQRHVGG